MASTPWRPSRPVTILLGFATIWPLLYIVSFFGFIFFLFARATAAPQPQAFDAFRYVFALHVLTMILMFALTIVYIVHAYRTDQIAEDRRMIWIVILFFGNLIAFPIYWYLYLWKAGDRAA